MTEPPRPPGDGSPNDPTEPFNPYAANDPGPASTPPPGYQPPPADYQQPPAGYQAPPPGYQQPYNAPPPGPGYGYNAQDDRTWILVAHFGGAAGTFVGGALAGWIVPLIVMLAKGNQSASVRAESVKALNFQLLWSIIGLVGWATSCIGIGFVIVAIAWIVAIVFGIIAGIKASNGEQYNYPMSVAIIK